MAKVMYRVEYKKSTDTEWSPMPNLDLFNSLASAQDSKKRFDRISIFYDEIWESRIVKITTKVIS